MIKLYKNGGTVMKYTGSNDSFDLKLNMFYDVCRLARMPQEEYRGVFSLMLAGDALDFYYSGCLRLTMSCDAVFEEIKNNFGDNLNEYRR
jgi:hypothetical protein